jgi:poly(3-hydroxybutyrate) depolymerase
MNFLGTTVSVYLLLTAAVFVMQRTLLYPAARHAPSLAAQNVAGLREVATQTPDGLRLRHWYLPPAEPGTPVLVMFHGNAGHIGDRVPKLDEIIDAGFGVLLAGYRGYSGNPGKPTEDDLTADAHLLLDWLAEQGVPAERTVIYGESLGTGVAVKMAAMRETAGVILESPYTSIAEPHRAHSRAAAGGSRRPRQDRADPLWPAPVRGRARAQGAIHSRIRGPQRPLRGSPGRGAGDRVPAPPRLRGQLIPPQTSQISPLSERLSATPLGF